jgi:Tol biopolymer transport system component
VFTGKNDLGSPDIFIIDADGSDETNLTNDIWEDGWPSFSPDGSRIMYSGSQGYDIWIMKADGSERENLTNTPGEMEWRGTWSPLGDYMAYISLGPQGEGIGTLKIMDLKTKTARKLFDDVWSEYFVEIVSEI